ncbi:hypothetical protein KAU33_05310 [Candidatus Dependentiae bacterium]|nr:hypothetical protein [Candidatus Dependentiae bacterium]
MKTNTLYKNFFDLLDTWTNLTDSQKLELFHSQYFIINENFFNYYYFNYLDINKKQLGDRVLGIQPEHYAQIKELCQNMPPEKIVRPVIDKCKKLLDIEHELNIFLIIGFFTPEGISVSIEEIGEKNIVIGLERFKEFNTLEIIIAHEYGHCLFDLKSTLTTYEKFHREGLAFFFSSLIFPEKPLTKIVFMTDSDIYEIKNNIEDIKHKIFKDEFSQINLFKYSDIKLPNRFGNLASYLYIKDLSKTLSLKKIINIKNPKEQIHNWVKT